MNSVRANHIPQWTPDIPTTVRTIKAGAHDFLTKPVTSYDLLRAIEMAFAHHKSLAMSGAKWTAFAPVSRH